MKQSITQYIMANKANLAAGKVVTIPVAWDDVVPDQQNIVTKSYKVDDTRDGSFTIYHLPESAIKKTDQFDKLDESLNKLDSMKISREEFLNFGNIIMHCKWYSYSAHTKVQLNINEVCILMNDVAAIKSVLLSVKNAILVSSIEFTEKVTLVFPTSTSEAKEIICTEAEANLIASAIRVCIETMVKTRKKESHKRHIAKKVKHTLNSEYKQDTFDLDGNPYTFMESGSRHIGDYYILDINELGDIVNVQTPILKQFPDALSRELVRAELHSIAIGSKDSADPVAKFEYLMTAESFPEKYSDAEYDECQAFIRSIKEPEEIPSLEEILTNEFNKLNAEIETSEYSEVSEVIIDVQAQ